MFRVQAAFGSMPLRRLSAAVRTAVPRGLRRVGCLNVQDLALLLLVLFPADEASSMQVCQLPDLANRVDDQRCPTWPELAGGGGRPVQ